MRTYNVVVVVGVGRVEQRKKSRPHSDAFNTQTFILFFFFFLFLLQCLAMSSSPLRVVCAASCVMAFSSSFFAHLTVRVRCPKRTCFPKTFNRPIEPQSFLCARLTWCTCTMAVLVYSMLFKYIYVNSPTGPNWKFNLFNKWDVKRLLNW